MRPASSDQTRVRVLRVVRCSTRLTLAQIAARAGCHPDTARRHLSQAGRWPPGSLLLAASPTPLTRREAAVMEGLARDSDPGAPIGASSAELAARRVVCPLGMLEKFATSNDPSVRAAVAANPDCPQETLERLAGDPSAKVRANAAANRCAPGTLVAALARDPGWGAAEEAQSPADHADARSDPGARIRSAAAANRQCPRQVLLRLALDPNPAVRVSAARNHKCPRRLLARLASDPYRSVRAAVASNPAAAGATLVHLSRDRVVAVREAVAERLSSPLARTVSDAAIDELAESRDISIRQAALDAAYARYTRPRPPPP